MAIAAALSAPVLLVAGLVFGMVAIISGTVYANDQHGQPWYTNLLKHLGLGLVAGLVAALGWVLEAGAAALAGATAALVAVTVALTALLNKLTGQRWDKGLLANLVLALATLGVGAWNARNDFLNQWMLGYTMINIITILLCAVYSGVLLYVSWSDIRTRRIPNKVIGPAMLLALAVMLWTTGIASALLGALFAPLPLIIGRRVAGAQQVGMGDIKLALFIGLVLGYPSALWSVLVALVLAVVVGAFGVLRGTYTWRSTLPFGPFLAVGALPLLVYTYVLR